jgi:hypothetical protein
VYLAFDILQYQVIHSVRVTLQLAVYRQSVRRDDKRFFFFFSIEPLQSLLLFFIILGGVRLSPLGTVTITGQSYQLQLIDDCDCGAIGGMKIGRGNRSTWRKPTPAPLCPPQVPHDQTRTRTWVAKVGSQ